jgi:hypothetical protein
MLRILFSTLLFAVFAGAEPQGAGAETQAGEHLNLLPNSSFEAGIDAAYAIGRWYVNGLPGAALDRDTKVHGEVSLRVPFSRRGYSARPVDGIELRAGAPVEVRAGETYTFSCYLRSDRPGPGTIGLSPNAPEEHAGAPVAKTFVRVIRDWSRFSITFKPAKAGKVYWFIEMPSNAPGCLWIDALQMEAGRPTEYRPAASFEAGLADLETGRIHAPDAPLVFAIRAWNDGDSEERKTVSLELRDVGGETLLKKGYDLSVPAHAGMVREILVPFQNRGIFTALLRTEGEEGPGQKTAFSVLPKPRPIGPDDSSFGAYVTAVEEALIVLQRAGFHRSATLTSEDRMAVWSAVEAVQGQFRGFDAEVDLLRRRGFEPMFNLEAWNYPAWAEGLSPARRREAFGAFVREIVGHYKGKVKYFTVTDEIHNKVAGNDMLGRRKPSWNTPEEYAEWHAGACLAAKEANPDSRVILNSGYDFGSRVLRTLDPGCVDILAGNYYADPGTIGSIRQLADSKGIRRVWAPGVAVLADSLYARGTSGDRLREACDRLVKSAVRTFSNGADVLFHYTATYVGNTNGHSLFEHDSALKANGVQFGALAWLLDGFSRVRRIASPRLDRVEIHRFSRKDGKEVFAVWSNDPGEEQYLSFPWRNGGPAAYDQWTNALEYNIAEGKATLPAGRPIFLVASREEAEGLENALVKATVAARGLP